MLWWLAAACGFASLIMCIAYRGTLRRDTTSPEDWAYYEAGARKRYKRNAILLAVAAVVGFVADDEMRIADAQCRAHIADFARKANSSAKYRPLGQMAARMIAGDQTCDVDELRQAATAFMRQKLIDRWLPPQTVVNDPRLSTPQMRRDATGLPTRDTETKPTAKDAYHPRATSVPGTTLDAK